MTADVDKALLLKVAEAIADRTPVDWEGDREKGAGLESSLKQFRIIESVAAIHEVKDVVEAPDARDLDETVTEPSEPSKISTGGPIPKRWGPLQIKERIGGGGFGEIFRAYDPNLKIDVALKLLRRDRPGGDAADERFLDEARRLARVRHSNVLVVHGAERHDGRVGIWSDLIDGKTLEDRLQAEGPSSPQEAALIGIDLCHALAAVHQQGLVHGDVKTSNVMRERQGNIILMDFSSASERFSAQPVSDQEAIHGTPFFMAPEVLMGERKCSPASDIYSLGVLLYRLVSGKFPVMADSLLNLCQKHRNREAVPIRDVRPDLSPQFVQVLDQALEREPEQRYGTAGEMERALKTVIGVPHKEMKPLPKRPWWSRRSLLAALGGVLVASVVIYLFFLPGGFQVEATLYRAMGDSEERLSDGSEIHPGDQLFLKIRGSEQMQVYVLNEDAAGEAFVLFPLSDIDLQNPLPADVWHRLPGRLDRIPQFWEVTSSAGRDSVWVIASRQPLDAFEREIASLPRAGTDAPPPLSARALGQLRGIGGLSGEEISPGPGPRRPVGEVLDRIPERTAGSSGIWIWHVEFENPGR